MDRRLSRVVFAMAVALTALFAHIAIDVAGDYLLDRDSYDDVAHHSRESIFTLAAVLAVLALWRTLRAACVELKGSHGTLRSLLRTAVPASQMRFIVSVMAAAVPALLSMAALDSLVDARRPGGVDDLLGGSLPLGLFCAFATSLLVGAAVWGGVRVLAKFDRAVLLLVAALAQRPRNPLGDAPQAHWLLAPRCRTAASVCAGSFDLRGPPGRG